MDVTKLSAVALLFWIFSTSTCFAIQHARNLIWAQTPALRLTVSRLVGIEGDPHLWVPAKSPSVKHISAPHYGWKFKALGFSYRNQLLVWSESMNKKIQGLYLNGSTETMDIFTGTSPEVNGLAVDWISNNVYWTDALYNWVLMAPLQTYTDDRVFKIIVQEGLDNPHGLAVYPEMGILLLSDWGVRPRIETMDLLGQGRHVLVEKDMLQPRGLTLDVQQARLYWVDTAKYSVESVFLKGVDLQRQIIKMDTGTRFFDLAVFNDYIFMTEQKEGLLKVLRKGSNEDAVSFTLGNVPFGIIMYDEDQQPGHSGLCETFGCSQMCVEDPRAGPKCLCGEGYELADDMKGCERHKHFVHPSHLYAIGVAICMYPAHIADMSLDNVSLSSQCFLSDRLGYLALTFDAGENMLYYSGNFTNTISSVPLESGAKSKVVASGTGTVKGMALDWVSDTLYWTDSTNAYIKVSRKDGRFQRILLEKDVNNPLGIAVHPARGKIYWTDIGFQPDVLPKIEMANMDGSEREILMKDNLGQPNHILIDYRTDKLYWADSILYHIRQYDLNDRTLTVFFEQPNVKFYGLSLYKDYILWTDTEDMNGIHVARLDTQRKVRGIIHPSYGMAADLITFDKLLQPDLQSPCNNSKQCDQLCLPRGASNYTCSCGLGFQLVGSTSCTVGKISKDNFLIVSDAYQRNLYQIDSRSGAITAMSEGERHEPIALDYHPAPSNRLYWSDNTVHVMRRKPLDNSEPETFMKLPEDSVVDGLTIDYQNNLLFYTDTGRDMIAVVTTELSPPRHAVIINEGLDEPRAIAVSPADGKIYWTDWGLNASISEAKMNGEQRKVLMRFNQTAWPNGLAIDTKERALYWADANRKNIGMLHLDSQTHRILIIEPRAHYFGIFLMGDFLYVTDWKRSYVARMHKHGGELMQFGQAKFTKMYGITGYNSTETPRGGTGICANQTKCDNVSICVPHTAAVFQCVCIDGYQRIGPTCQKIIITTIATTTATTPSTTSTVTPTAISSQTTFSSEQTTEDRIPVTVVDNGDVTASNDSDDTYDHTLAPSTISTDSANGDSSNESGSGNSGAGSDNTGDKTGKGKKGGKGDNRGGNKKGPVGAKTDTKSDAMIWILVASIVAGVALLLIVAFAAVYYFRRRRGYNVPHTRLTEEKGRRGSARGSTVSTSSSSTVHSSKVTYARHNSNDSVQLDEGFENPTYGVTMAMLTDQ